MWDNIYQPDQTGSEGGLIISDEEYKDSCRITLEKCERYYAITCGVYGGMMHTAFCTIRSNLLLGLNAQSALAIRSFDCSRSR